MLVQNIDYMVNYSITKKNSDIINELITNYLHKLADPAAFISIKKKIETLKDKCYPVKPSRDIYTENSSFNELKKKIE